MKKSGIIGVIVLISIVVLLIYLYYPSSEPIEDCANEGEQYSKVFVDEYPATCCSDLIEWEAGMHTGISIEDECYATGLLSGNPVGICINCGNDVCEDIEDPCSCPQDCVGKERSRYNTIQEFCDEYWDENRLEYCENVEHLPFCDLC